MNKFVRTESHTGNKFPKTTLGLLYTRVIVVVHLYCIFLTALDGATANRQILDRIFGQLFTSLRKDNVANYASIWTLFSPDVSAFGVLHNALNFS